MALLVIVCILGLGFAAILPKNFNTIYKILIAPSLGLITFTQITLIFSFFVGISFPSIILSLFVTAILSFTCFLKFKWKAESYNLSLTFLFAIIIATLFLSYIWFTQALFVSSDGLRVGGGGMYGDTALHAAYTSRLATGEFPIQNPLYAGKILVYPFANDLFSAILRTSGLNFNLAFTLPQILFLIGFLTLFYQIVRKFTSNFGFIMALLILFLGWGIGALFFLKEWQISDMPFWQFLTRDYTDNSQYNLYFRNILTGLVLPERSFLPGLFLGLLVFWNFLEYFANKNLRFLIINGVILGALPFWHTHTFVFFSIASLIFAVWLMRENLKKTLTDFFLMSIVALVMAIPFLFLFFSNHQVGQFLHISLGWQNGNENILLFWFKNSLLTIPLASLGFWFVKHGQKIFFVPAFVVFIIANLVIFQPWDWDNIKLLSWSFLFFAILVGFLLAKYAQKGIVAKAIVGVLILISIASGFLSLTLQFKNKYVIYDKADIDLADWAKKNTEVGEIFLIEPFPNHPIPGLSGRLVYMGYPGHLWVHGINYSGREQVNNQILTGNFSQINNLEVPISYIVLSRYSSNFNASSNFQEVYQNAKYRILKID